MTFFIFLGVLLAANLPYFYHLYQNKFKLKLNDDAKTSAKKPSLWIWLLWLCNYGVILSGMLFFEWRNSTKIYEKFWEFYAITFLLYLVMSFPSLMHALFQASKSKVSAK